MLLIRYGAEITRAHCQAALENGDLLTSIVLLDGICRNKVVSYDPQGAVLDKFSPEKKSLLRSVAGGRYFENWILLDMPAGAQYTPVLTQNRVCRGPNIFKASHLCIELTNKILGFLLPPYGKIWIKFLNCYDFLKISNDSREAHPAELLLMIATPPELSLDAESLSYLARLLQARCAPDVSKVNASQACCVIS